VGHSPLVGHSVGSADGRVDGLGDGFADGRADGLGDDFTVGSADGRADGLGDGFAIRIWALACLTETIQMKQTIVNARNEMIASLIENNITCTRDREESQKQLVATLSSEDLSSDLLLICG